MSDGFHDIADVLDRVYREQDAMDAADEGLADEGLVAGLRVAVDSPSVSLPHAA
ncbi:MAG TPA: hypothetical protein VGD48_12610 [Kutzneria sp.]|jgi:hypothetical protein